MSITATEFLSSKNPPPPHGVIVMYGPERFFRSEILHHLPGVSGEEAESAVTRLNGEHAEIREVMSELKTVSMFGDRRIVLIEDADDFVTANRPALEKYAASPAKGSLLILDVKSFPKTTKLYKLVDQHGLAVECAELTGANLLKWLQRVAKEQYGKDLDRESAALIVQLAGDGLGMLLQEVAKLASLVGEVAEITRDDVVKVVGGWRTETTWVMLDAVRDGNLNKALEALNKLMMAGEAPQKILGGVTFTFRKLAEATERARAGTPLREAISVSGIFPAAIAPSETYLRRIGFERASRILQLLIEADTEMKGGSRVDPRLLLERLFVRLAGEPVASSLA
ncbi:MAG: DNA polymerase III subunit delta [Planctomycetaceae bacterium]|nr:DNA polymerase III subunit delta [Planctomycetaceae bacterium]